MEFKIVTNKSEWDTFVSTFDYTTMFLSWEWCQFEQKIGSKLETWGVYENNVLIGVLPMKTIKARRGKYLHIRHAPLIDWDNEELAKNTIEFLKQKAKEKGLHFIRISPLLRNTSENTKMLEMYGLRESVIHATDAELTVALDLTKSEDTIFQEMRKTTRNSIKKAEKLELVVMHTNNFDLFDDFISVYKDTVARQGWNAYSESYIRSEYEIFSSAGKADMFVSYYKGEPISASIFIRHNNQVIYHFSGSVTKFRDIPSSYLLHWEAIKFFKNEGFKLYNFWGVSPENNIKHPWYGLSLFKRGFTSNELEFVHSHDLDIRPFAYLTHTFEYIESRLRGYR